MRHTSTSHLDHMRDVFPPQRAKETMFRPFKGIVFNPGMCNGCGKCESACSRVGIGSDDGIATLRASRIHIEPMGEKQGFAFYCQHCLDPQCMKVCPHGALSKDKDGIVRMNKLLCVNCGLCIAACPQAAPLREADGNVVKCDLCGGNPACVPVCEEGALRFTTGNRLHLMTPLRWGCQIISFLLCAVVLIGSVCSLNVATFDISCPFGVLQNVFSARAIVLTTVLSGAALLVSSLLLGRFFCGWICPFGFVLDVIDAIIPHKLFRLPKFLRNKSSKYSVSVGALGAAAVTGTQAFCTVCPIGTLCRSHGLNTVMAGAEAAMIPAVAMLNLGERRSWCRYFCPVGALFGLVARIGLVRIEIGASKCRKFSCMRCAEICPMGAISKENLVQGVSPNVDMSVCITCMRCVSACPHGAAVLRFVWQKSKTEACDPVVKARECFQAETTSHAEES